MYLAVTGWKDVVGWGEEEKGGEGEVEVMRCIEAGGTSRSCDSVTNRRFSTVEPGSMVAEGVEGGEEEDD